MANIFVISDTHFGHEEILGFRDKQGQLIRPGFANTYEMDEFIIERWNSVVRTGDKVYHLGDVAMRRWSVALVQRLNGKKRLVMGNHDIYGIKPYLKWGFQEIYGTRVLEVAKGESIVLSHIPINAQSLGRFLGNVHGHTHTAHVADPRYLNVSVEVQAYTPIEISEAARQLRLAGAPPPAPMCALRGACV